MRDLAKIPGYEPVWEDDFSSGGPDIGNWSITVRPSGRNGELQRYVDDPDVIFVRDGMLHIRPVRQVIPDGSVRYLSGLISTVGKQEFHYGRFEARIKVPEGRGFLPVFSIEGDPSKFGSMPLCGAMDIMEILGRDTGVVYGSVHYGVTNVTEQGLYRFSVGDDPATDFHTYSLEWEPGTIRWLVDGVEYFRCSEPEELNHPFHLSIGLAIGGRRAGDPDDTTVFGEESDLVVDYVRVLRKEQYAKYEKGRRRKLLGVCGVWEDAENFNLFVRALQAPEVTKDYVLAAFTFGIPTEIQRVIEVEEKFADFINSTGLDAVVIFSEMIKMHEIVERLVASAKKRGIPIVVFENGYKGCTNAKFDYAGGFEGVVRHIVEHHGCRKVDMFAGFRGNSFSEERIEVYKKVLADNGIAFDPDRLHYGDFWDAIAERTMTALIETGYPLPEAIVCANDSMAVGVCDSLKKHGYKIPDDVLVTGFDGIWHSYCHNPGITTCEIDYDEMRRKVMEVLNDPQPDPEKTITISYKTVIRGSCGCAAETREKWSDLVTALYNDNHDYFRHILEMGRFISQTISMSEVVEATADLENYLWLWRDQYYFIGIKEGDSCIHAVFEGYKGRYKYDRRFFNLPAPLPEMDSILREGSGINVLLFKQARSSRESFGYIVCGYEELTLRDEQRFEEYSLFVSSVLHSAINNRKLVAANTEIEHMSESDYLTGLLNRRGFFKAAGNALAKNENKGKYLTLFAADMDGLKSINDNFGHFDGDLAIQSLALAIKSFVGDRGFCARFGGDEFCFVVIGDKPLADKVPDIRDRINNFIETDSRLKDRDYIVGASLGCAERVIDGKIDIEKVMREADLSMYKDKYLRKSDI